LSEPASPLTAAPGRRSRSTEGLEAGIVDSGPTCVAATCEGKRCTDAGCGYFPDCRRLRDGVGGSTGTYLFRRDGAGDTFSAHCEMTLAGGGWTLVAQSVGNGPNGSFVEQKRADEDVRLGRRAHVIDERDERVAAGFPFLARHAARLVDDELEDDPRQRAGRTRRG